ncbi:PREDICTED: probable phospholipase A2 homolog 1 [Fragaria vesca subsp. vesca]|uniref:probable phospholipase A2 homolog 1 n=1 Tax=Fragaria vesca subsp. vesca TaxID=101020 RepID=UPI0002C32180|nr:PREDICTED: probable phospholipase A2 homolog 1 [Fragaria vesca subsp. vesca]
MLGAPAVTTRVAAAFAVSFILLASVAHCSNNNSEELCSRTCAAENCNSVGIRYGKYCGVGWTGCPGEKPCDDVDACCKIHDDCVGNTGVHDVKCHEKFKKCIKKVHKSGKVGFSKQCPYETVVPTMVQGMDLAIMFSQFSNSKLEL